MARLDRDRPAPGPLVQAFSGTGFRVDGKIHAMGVKLTPLVAIEWCPPLLGALDLPDFSDLLAIAPPPEFLLFGTGTTLRRPDPGLIAAIEAQGLGVEIMDSRAAARAWGVLRGEDRWIVAALMPFDQL